MRLENCIGYPFIVLDDAVIAIYKRKEGYFDFFAWQSATGI